MMKQTLLLTILISCSTFASATVQLLGNHAKIELTKQEPKQEKGKKKPKKKSAKKSAKKPAETEFNSTRSNRERVD